MKKSHLIILGAGKPHYGDELASLKKIYEKNNALNLILKYAKKLSLKVTFVSGYQNNKLKKNFPKLNIVYNKYWKKTGPIYSLSKVKIEDNEDLIIIYSDILIRYQYLKKIVKDKSGYLCAIDSKYKNRYKYIDKKNLNLKEKVFFKNLKEYNFTEISNFKKTSELIGIIKVSKTKILEFQKLIKQICRNKNIFKISDLLQIIKKKNKIVFLDVKGDWAEINKSEDISNYILGSKSETLQRLKILIKKGIILDQVNFNLKDWNLKKKEVLKKINIKFKNKPLIVRSSAIDEDGLKLSNAGKYLSILDVKGKKKTSYAITKVIKSFNKNDLNNQIFVQEHIKKAEYVGVITTKSKGSGSPWYVINYQKTKDTELITKGDTNQVKTILIRRDFSKLDKNFFYTKLLLVIKDIEKILFNFDLDIEFAITKKNEIYIFQVRPLYVRPENKNKENKILKNYHFYERKFSKYKINSTISYNQKPYFGVMPDWNPAEIIGFKPNNLSFSLYKKLITDKIWAKQRYEFGYRKLTDTKLIVNFCGTPYVCVNKSLESFIPNNLPKYLAKKILNLSLERLKENPTKHDKIEFDIIQNCLDFNFTKWKKIYLKNNFKNYDIKLIKKSFITINKNAQKIYKFNSIKFDKFKNIKIPIFKNDIYKAKFLLDFCFKKLTLIFAHFARCGFISVIIMNTALKNKIISKRNYKEFFNSVSTISKEFQNDFIKFKKNKISKMKLKNKYGHLRPGTYDINSKRYDDNIDSLIINTSKGGSIDVKVDKKKIFNQNIINKLKNLGFNGKKDDLIDFFYGSIEKREASKFLFTKYLSDYLKILSLEFKKKGLTENDISMLNLKNINDYFLGKINLNKIKNIINKNYNIYKVNIASDMPNLIFKLTDFKKFNLIFDEPNFVGENVTFSDIISLSKTQKFENLNNKIVLIDSADPGYDWIFNFKIKGLVTKYGGVNSHMAIRCAELNLTAAIGVGEKTFQNLSSVKKVLIDPKNKILKII